MHNSQLYVSLCYASFLKASLCQGLMPNVRLLEETNILSVTTF